MDDKDIALFLDGYLNLLVEDAAAVMANRPLRYAGANLATSDIELARSALTEMQAGMRGEHRDVLVEAAAAAIGRQPTDIWEALLMRAKAQARAAGGKNRGHLRTKQARAS